MGLSSHFMTITFTAKDKVAATFNVAATVPIMSPIVGHLTHEAEEVISGALAPEVATD